MKEREYRLFIQSLATYLGHYKQATGKTQKEIGKQAGLSQTTVSRIIRYQRKGVQTKTLWKILNATGKGDSLRPEVLFHVRLREVRKERA